MSACSVDRVATHAAAGLGLDLFSFLLMPSLQMDFEKGHSHGLEVASSQITGVMQTQPPEQRPEQQKSGDNC